MMRYLVETKLRRLELIKSSKTLTLIPEYYIRQQAESLSGSSVARPQASPMGPLSPALVLCLLSSKSFF